MMLDNRITIRPLVPSDAAELLDLRLRNHTFLQPFEPIQPDSHFTLDAQQHALQTALDNRERGTGFTFGVCLRDTGALIGRVSLSNVARGVWQNCTIGYFLDKQMNGLGYTTEAVRLAVRFAFEEANLHRVQAAIMPWNVASVRVVTKVGFRYEGLARHYLNINGVWEDHAIYAMTLEDYTVSPDDERG